tara:strand:+ start:619 stop:819 length:201 start_codon:yes stop_codon:yes gene_type:complete
MPSKPQFSAEQLERIGRIYRSNTDAAIAMGINVSSVTRTFRKQGVLSPNERRQREKSLAFEEKHRR